MDDRELARWLIRCVDEDNHRFAYVGDHFGGEALLDSHLPMLDLIRSLARDWQVMDPADVRYAGLTYALRELARAYLDPDGV